jgi:hypothetical protein
MRQKNSHVWLFGKYLNSCGLFQGINWHLFGITEEDHKKPVRIASATKQSFKNSRLILVFV